MLLDLSTQMLKFLFVNLAQFVIKLINLFIFIQDLFRRSSSIFWYTLQIKYSGQLLEKYS